MVFLTKIILFRVYLPMIRASFCNFCNFFYSFQQFPKYSEFMYYDVLCHFQKFYIATFCNFFHANFSCNFDQVMDKMYCKMRFKKHAVKLFHYSSISLICNNNDPSKHQLRTICQIVKMPSKISACCGNCWQKIVIFPQLMFRNTYHYM